MTTQSEYQKKWREENRDKCRAAGRKYHHLNKEKRNIAAKKWQAENKDRLIARRKEYYRERKEIWGSSYARLKSDPIKWAKYLKGRRDFKRANRDRMRAEARAYYYKNREKMIRYGVQWHKGKRGRFNIYRIGARQRKITFGLTFEQFMAFWQKDCHYCGAQISTIGIDRVDNLVGYVLGNVVSCCTDCNLMKRHYTQKFFLDRIRMIASRFPA